MDEAEKKKCSEIDICDLFITPAIKQAGWDQMQQIRREVTLAPGPVVVRGNPDKHADQRARLLAALRI
ncbi:MAG: hypothetical protein ACOY4N_08495 [Pseudomonadota bacterium]